jgi:methionine sulfoxide reductase heme-binding subunit
VRDGRVNGWRVFWLLAALESALFAGGIAVLGTDEAGLRALTRFTVRVSFTIFIAVYAAAPLRKLFASPVTRWLARNRRYLGVSFAWAHALHALAIALLARSLGDAFEADTTTLVGGGLGYLLTAAMALTSFDRTARWLGPHRWGQLHRAGLHWLWFVFALNWTSLAATSPSYLPFAALTWSAAALRLAALRARRRSPEAIAHPA